MVPVPHSDMDPYILKHFGVLMGQLAFEIKEMLLLWLVIAVVMLK